MFYWLFLVHILNHNFCLIIIALVHVLQMFRGVDGIHIDQAVIVWENVEMPWFVRLCHVSSAEQGHSVFIQQLIWVLVVIYQFFEQLKCFRIFQNLKILRVGHISQFSTNLRSIHHGFHRPGLTLRQIHPPLPPPDPLI